MEELANKLEEYELIINELQTEIDLKNKSFIMKSKEIEELLMIIDNSQKEIENLNEYVLKLTDEKNYEKEKSLEDKKNRRKKYENELLLLKDQIIEKEEMEKILLKNIEKMKLKNVNILTEMELKIKKFVSIDQYNKKLEEIEKMMKEKENLLNTISLKNSKIKSLDFNFKSTKEKNEK